MCNIMSLSVDMPNVKGEIEALSSFDLQIVLPVSRSIDPEYKPVDKWLMADSRPVTCHATILSLSQDAIYTVTESLNERGDFFNCCNGATVVYAAC